MHASQHAQTTHVGNTKGLQPSQVKFQHDKYVVQAQHDQEAAQLSQVLRGAACTPLLTLAPSVRTPEQLTALEQLVQGLQVLACFRGMTHDCHESHILICSFGALLSSAGHRQKQRAAKCLKAQLINVPGTASMLALAL